MQWHELFITATQLDDLNEGSKDDLIREPNNENSAPRLKIFDCRFSLAVGDKPAKGKAFYDESHIPNADYLDLEQDLSGDIDDSTGRHPLLSQSQQEALIRRHQLDTDSTIICYDDGKLAFAARAWFTFHLMGFHRVRLLSGGFPAWQSMHNQAYNSSSETLPQKPLTLPLTLPLPAVKPPIRLTTLAQALSESKALIDAREAIRFEGKHEPIDPVAGAIPSAINMPWLDCFDEEGQFKPTDWHRNRWQRFNTACHYCGSGVTALVNILSALLASDQPQDFYSGGWSEYIRSKQYLNSSNKAD